MFARLGLATVVVAGMTAVASAAPAVVATSVNLRAGPGPDYAVIAVLPRGATVAVESCRANWCEVTYGSRRGFASQRYITARHTAPAIIVVPPPPPVPPFLLPTSWPRAHPPMPGAACFARGALWSISHAATPAVVQRARQGAAARTVRVIRPGELVIPDFIPHRLNLVVDGRDVIATVGCG